jgi:hypothetical protein
MAVCGKLISLFNELFSGGACRAPLEGRLCSAGVEVDRAEIRRIQIALKYNMF